MSSMAMATGSVSRTTTPLRALPSNLALKSSPTIPPSSQTYEPLVKSVLRRRLLYNIFLYSLVSSWAVAIVWMTWVEGGSSALGAWDAILIPFTPATLSVALGSWIAAVLPIVLLRKSYLTGNRTVAGSPSKTVNAALSKASTQRAWFAYIASATLITVLHAVVAHANEVDPRLRLFVKSRKHPYYLNGRLVYLLFSQITIASGYLVRDIMLDRFAFRWNSSSIVSKWPFGVLDILRATVTIIVFASLSVPLSALLFGLVRIILPITFKLPLVHYLLRPFLAHFLRGSWSIFLPFQHIGLLVRAWLLGLTTLTSWEAGSLLFDAFVTQPIAVSQLTADPSTTLISGISTPDKVFKYFAYSELKELSMDESPAASARRTALFGDQKYTPSLWSHLVRESLLLLGNDYQLFLRRGAPPPPPAPPVALPKAPPAAPPSTPVALLKKPIYQSAKQSPIRAVLNSLASDGSLVQAVDASAEAAHIPELFRSVEAAVLPPPDEVQKGVEDVKGVVGFVRGKVDKTVGGIVRSFTPSVLVGAGEHWQGWWREERLSRAVTACLPAGELDVLVVDVLSQLTCASLTEDRYGVVQRDIPKILEAMLSFLSAIEEYQVEINALYTPPRPEEALSSKELVKKEALRIEVERSGETLGLVGTGLKEGVARIVRIFGDKLLAFKFPPRTASKLQGFLDYC